MEYINLYRISSYLLMLGLLGHTLGGMLGTAKRGVNAGPVADEVFEKMKSVSFEWRGGNCTWFGFWLGNGLGVSALLVPVIAILYTLGGLSAEQSGNLLPIAWTTVLSLFVLSFLGFKYFISRIGIVFGLIALLSGIATIQVSFNILNG